jgi:molybdopterin synthase catalytic subunit
VSAGTVAAVSTPPLIARVVDEPLSLAEHEDAVADKAAGAVVSFAGVVRDHDGGRGVTELEYVGHPTAQQVIAELAEEFARRPDVHAVAVSHRVGLLGIGDVALACAVSTSHRGAAFAACAELVDLVKERLPIWKRQVFSDGEEEWVACP